LVSYLCGLYLDSFQTKKNKKTLLRWLLHLYISSFNSSLEAVYSVCVKTNWFSFTRTIGYSSRNLYWICTKVGTEICYNVSFLCTKFQLDPNIHVLAFIAIFPSMWKDENEWNFGHFYLWKAGVISLWFAI